MSDNTERESFVGEALAVLEKYPGVIPPTESQLKATVEKMNKAAFKTSQLLLTALKANLEAKS